MKGYIANIEELAINNTNFRQVLYTAKNCQLVLMSLKPGEDIGEEIHDVDQFFRIEQGSGEAKLGEVTHEVADGSSIVVPAGMTHNITNTGSNDLKLYTLYSPPHHQDGTVHESKAVAEGDDEHFDGQTTE